MSANETINTSPTGAKKAGNLERFDLIPVEALRELAEHYGRGSLKYDDHNWRKGYNWSLSYAALQRHATQFWNGEDVDTETGSKHIIAVAWHAFTLATYMDEQPEFDDRFTSITDNSEAGDPEEWASGQAEERLPLDETIRVRGWSPTVEIAAQENGYWYNKVVNMIYRFREPHGWECRDMDVPNDKWSPSYQGRKPFTEYRPGEWVGIGMTEPL